jgi:predicted nucleic acid-binding protein
VLTEAWAMRGHVTVADAIYVAMAVHLDAVLSLPI